MIRSKLSGQTSKPREYGRLRVRKIGFSSQTLLFRDCVSMRGRRRKKKGKKKKRKKKRKKKWKNHFSRFLATLDTLRSSLNELITFDRRLKKGPAEAGKIPRYRTKKCSRVPRIPFLCNCRSRNSQLLENIQSARNRYEPI